MSEFIKEPNCRSAIKKSEIVTVRYVLTKAGVTVTFKLKTGDEITWADCRESDVLPIIENL